MIFSSYLIFSYCMFIINHMPNMTFLARTSLISHYSLLLIPCSILLILLYPLESRGLVLDGTQMMACSSCRGSASRRPTRMKRLSRRATCTGTSPAGMGRTRRLLCCCPSSTSSPSTRTPALLGIAWTMPRAQWPSGTS